ncbi:hypothetical protein HI914_02851 [Erysiphe necator]|nr:hypothetical protein HI914_02851 [Erysiphe necator]
MSHIALTVWKEHIQLNKLGRVCDPISLTVMVVGIQEIFIAGHCWRRKVFSIKDIVYSESKHTQLGRLAGL